MNRLLVLAVDHAALITSQAGRVLISASASLLMCLFLSPKFIEFLRRRSSGQSIQEEITHHAAKQGTPNMGGIVIVLSFAIPYISLSTREAKSMGVFAAVLACAFLGFCDDYIKVHHQRSLGLRARTKMIGMIAISVLIWFIAVHWAHVSTSVSLRPFDAHIDFGPFFIVFVYLVVASTTNAVNLTDGLDGLAAGCCAIAFLAYMGITFITTGTGYHDLELAAGCLCGACIGFLWFNSFPASVFMGDTGSLALGGGIAALAIMTDTEVLLIIIGGIFVIEAASVIVQVFSFRYFQRRVFKMAPIHHHFIMEAWSETKVILRFWIVAAACGAVGFTLYQHSIRGLPAH
ncbi:phospho-N-acetylmuramoyl-pentapeptide-transferase [Conexibacter sp. DBS9H8]|uniref:phospho-N-acetylmuramoyl-pentapeptide- transferase n=1 Tax=Conexibacter sp. DBS9H8 TaxID=2937801 RepID=UPI00200D2CF9|nr:phospho-N-acetylmuramoyl-pentapeptide-transferase [Conexibacter sp. DBS9H8]